MKILSLLLVTLSVIACAGYSVPPQKATNTDVTLPASEQLTFAKPQEMLEVRHMNGDGVVVVYIDEKGRSMEVGQMTCKGNLKTVTSQRALKKGFEFLLQQQAGAQPLCPSK